MTTLSESRVPSDPDGRGPAKHETASRHEADQEDGRQDTTRLPDAGREDAWPQQAGAAAVPQVIRGQAVVRPAVRGQATVRSEATPPGHVYSSQHAIRSLIRSETETSAIRGNPDDARVDDDAQDVDARADDEEIDESANPEPPPAPKPVVMAATAPHEEAHDLDKVTAPVTAAEAGGTPRVRSKLLLVLPAVVALLMAFVVAVGYLALHEPAPSDELGRWAGEAATPATSAPEADPLGRDGPLAGGVPDPFHTQKLALAGAPTRLKIKSIGVDSSLETLKIGPAGELDPPVDFDRAGWYADGTSPGDIGPAVLAGHVDDKSGPAVFYKLRELAVGDKIQVVRGGKTVSFTVSATAWYPKNAFPTAKVYGPTPDSQLRLITCGGVFDHRLRSYKDNLVVYAVLG